ncbi:MAG: arylesterase [Acetobacteraceae bacterium]|nr:arylesterase [Acetobacteraceae bacterium]
MAQAPTPAATSPAATTPAAAAPAAAAQAAIRILALGDSLTAGFGLPRDEGFVAQLQVALREAGYPSLTVLDGGVSGDTTAGGRARLDWALAEKPHGAIVALGANDGLRGLPPAATAQNLAAILDRLLEREKIPVLLAGMKAPPNLGAEYGREFEQAFSRLAARPGVIFYPFFLEGVAAVPALNQPDGIHPNREGVAEMVRRMLPDARELAARAAKIAAERA